MQWRDDTTLPTAWGERYSEGANVFQFAPESGPPICAFNEYTP
jgi:hypothetical protein